MDDSAGMKLERGKNTTGITEKEETSVSESSGYSLVG
jgi:hypothetical protein